MRTLSFIVDGQIIRQHPNCDFDNLIPGSSGYLKAEFSFSSEWNNMIKVASFWRNGRECPPQILKDGVSCTIPEEALTNRQFEIGLLGKKDNMKITTNKVMVVQNGG